MMAMLANHGGEHTPGLLTVALASQASPAPWYFFPDEQSERVAQIQHQVRLLVMAKSDEIGSHVLDLLQFVACLDFGHGSPYPSMVLMTVSTPEQQSFTIQEERAILAKLKRAQAKLSLDDSTAGRCHHLNLASIALRIVRTPELRPFYVDYAGHSIAVPFLRLIVNLFTVGLVDSDGERRV